MSSDTFVRDKLTLVSYAQASCFGWLIFGSGPAINFLRDDLHLSRAMASAHSLGMSVGGVVAGLSAQKLIHHFGRGRLLRWASFVLIAGMLMFLLGRALPVTLLGFTLCFLGGVTIVQSTAAFLSHHQGRYASAAISELHGVAAGFGLLSPVVIGLCVTYGYGWRIGMSVGIIATVATELLRGRDVSKYGMPVSDEVETAGHDLPGALPRAFWWACLAMICTSGVEYAVMLWSSDYLRTNGGLAKGASAIALGCVVGAMAVGRLAGSVLTRKFASESLYRGSLALALIGFMGFWSSSAPVVMILCLSITGLGLSLHFPFGIERAIVVSHGRADRATTRIAIATAISSGVAPFLIGVLADQVDAASAFLVVPIALAIALAVASYRPVRVS
jgi:fucose permease